ncbi:MAG: PAS domain S-box protein, partial [Thermoanaerobaculia bacterium]|nr:PAS domain S-box protein [Thermoanaerobaculia bacterium]
MTDDQSKQKRTSDRSPDRTKSSNGGGTRNEKRRKPPPDRFLAAIVESTQEAVIGKDLEGTITSWNRGAERIYGYSSEEAIGRKIDIIVPPEKKKELASINRKLRRGEASETFETLRLRKDGSRVAVLLSVSPVRSADGSIEGAFGIAHDITRLKETERALRESEKRFRMMADRAPVLIWISNQHNRLEWVNQVWLDFRGRSLDSERNDGWLRGVHPEDRQELETLMERSLESRTEFRTEYRFLDRDGVYHWMLTHGVPRLDSDERFNGFIGSSIDITDQHEIEESLQYSKEKYHALVSATSSIVWTTDASGGFHVPQPSWEAFTGQTWEEY